MGMAFVRYVIFLGACLSTVIHLTWPTGDVAEIDTHTFSRFSANLPECIALPEGPTVEDFESFSIYIQYIAPSTSMLHELPMSRLFSWMLFSKELGLCLADQIWKVIGYKQADSVGDECRWILVAFESSLLESIIGIISFPEEIGNLVPNYGQHLLNYISLQEYVKRLLFLLYGNEWNVNDVGFLSYCFKVIRTVPAVTLDEVQVLSSEMNWHESIFFEYIEKYIMNLYETMFLGDRESILTSLDSVIEALEHMDINYLIEDLIRALEGNPILDQKWNLRLGIIRELYGVDKFSFQFFLSIFQNSHICSVDIFIDCLKIFEIFGVPLISVLNSLQEITAEYYTNSIQEELMPCFEFLSHVEDEIGLKNTLESCYLHLHSLVDVPLKLFMHAIHSEYFELTEVLNANSKFSEEYPTEIQSLIFKTIIDGNLDKFMFLHRLELTTNESLLIAAQIAHNQGKEEIYTAILEIGNFSVEQRSFLGIK